MPVYKAPLREYRFLLNETFNIAQYGGLPGFRDAPPDVVDAILDEAAKLAEEVLQPLNQSGDHEGCKLENGTVTTPRGFREAYRLLVEGGWPALVADPAYGGQGLPNSLGVIFNEMVSSANMAFGMYPGLSHGAYSALLHHGSDEQKRLYLPKLVSGEWTGTMNLTEPHCGTDLGLLRSKAVPQADGSYKISGQKIFISAGEHDLAENIIHLVLARIEGAPAGIKGISLFLVPKFLVKPDGGLGARNGVTCGALEKKMGIHANATCVLNYDEATGFLIGEENKGMRAMFTMMNEARLGVGLQGLSQSEVACQNAVAYARERLQGRALSGPKEAGKPADPLIVHPDVRRMLLTMKSLTEAARAICYANAVALDRAQHGASEDERRAGQARADLLTPIAKSFSTDIGVEVASIGVQVHGGMGFIEETGAAQYYRDARILPIYEGTNGIQAIDLVMRKLPLGNGDVVREFIAEMRATANAAAGSGHERLAALGAALESGLGALETATAHMLATLKSSPDDCLAGANSYLGLFGTVAGGHFLIRGAIAALKQGEGEPFAAARLATARFYAEHRLPAALGLLGPAMAGAAALYALDSGGLSD